MWDLVGRSGRVAGLASWLAGSAKEIRMLLSRMNVDRMRPMNYTKSRTKTNDIVGTQKGATTKRQLLVPGQIVLLDFIFSVLSHFGALFFIFCWRHILQFCCPWRVASDFEPNSKWSKMVKICKNAKGLVQRFFSGKIFLVENRFL